MKNQIKCLHYLKKTRVVLINQTHFSMYTQNRKCLNGVNKLKTTKNERMYDNEVCAGVYLVVCV